LHTVCSGQPEPASLEPEEGATVDRALEVHTNGDAENHISRGHIVVPEFLIASKFRTIVLDEAHHLRAEWWKVLTSFVKGMDAPTLVALTATPPYDVSPLEWQRYEELCGPVDAEVSVPELVQEGDLCPHQDYVYFSTPNPEELKLISDFRVSVDQFVLRLRSNVKFKDAVLQHPWVSAPDEHTEQILEDPEYLSSMVIFLHAVGQQVPSTLTKLL